MQSYNVFQALLSRPNSVARINAMRAAIERVGGFIEIESPTASGMVVVTLTLPPPYQPSAFFPDLPFYPA